MLSSRHLLTPPQCGETRQSLGCDGDLPQLHGRLARLGEEVGLLEAAVLALLRHQPPHRGLQHPSVNTEAGPLKLGVISDFRECGQSKGCQPDTGDPAT